MDTGMSYLARSSFKCLGLQFETHMDTGNVPLASDFPVIAPLDSSQEEAIFQEKEIFSQGLSKNGDFVKLSKMEQMNVDNIARKDGKPVVW